MAVDVKKVDKEIRDKIAARVCSDFERDIGSRKEYMDRVGNWYKLFAGFRRKKNFPWAGSSNVHVPLMGISCMAFHARAYEALLPSTDIVRAVATDGKSLDEAARVSKHLNWQVTEEMDEWIEDMDSLLAMLPIGGVEVKKTYYSPTLKRNVSRRLGIDSFVAPYRAKRLEDTSRQTHFYSESVSEIRRMLRNGTFNQDVEEGELASETEYQHRGELRDIVERVMGTRDERLEGDLEPDKHRLILEQHRGWDVDKDGINEPYIFTVDYASRQILDIQRRVRVDPVDREEKEFEAFTAYPFIVNPQSWMGFGFGHLLEGLNESANSIVNQLIDAGTLQNTVSGIINKRSGLKRGQIQFKMGQFVEADIAAKDIREAIYQWQFGEPSQTLYALLGLLQQYAQQITTVNDSVLGQMPPSDTPATTMLAVMEQGLKVFSVIHKRVHRSLKKELKKVFALNRVHLEEKKYFTVQDSTSDEIKTLVAGRKDYSNIIDVIPVSDPNITSKAEQLVMAKSVYEVATSNPLIAQNPEALYYATKKYLLANNLPTSEVDSVLPKPQKQEPQDVPPEEENANLIRGIDADAIPEQDHIDHIETHRAFADTVFYSELTPHAQKLHESHVREHLAFLYLQGGAQEEMNDTAEPGRLEGLENVGRNESVPVGVEE